MTHDSDSAKATSRLITQVRLITAAGVTLLAAIAGLWAYAEWGHRLPAWESMNPVAAYDAWKNRPAPVKATLTLAGNNGGEWLIDGQKIKITDASTQESFFEWANKRRLLITKLRIHAPEDASWYAMITLLYGAPNFPADKCVTVQTIPAYGKRPKTASFRPVICQHCSSHGRVLVDLEQLTGDNREYLLTAQIGGTKIQAEVGHAELGRTLDGYAEQARLAGIITQPRALTLSYFYPDTMSVADAVVTLNAFADHPEVEDISFAALESDEENSALSPHSTRDRASDFEKRLRRHAPSPGAFTRVTPTPRTAR